MRIETIIKEGKGTIVDVRTPGEFFGGNVKGSINIPLQEIPERMDEIKALNQPLILCCASGNRSGNAQGYLSSNGIDCVNGGPWFEVEYVQSKVVQA
ncbi:MAG: rhodanese-like domain-containing protein [Bacteroidia bacterium]|nr:rhodanese-like domain-containing protein [Bacteroidia bacterium]MCF8426097.1 rhodanese-like domain-containing protein [Bacteroidia bacterium]MCF8447797.1 rhodanese-like domain-containing protein [Bacteroidia bacterium]